MARRNKLKHDLDAGIKREVEILRAAGIETFESCWEGSLSPRLRKNFAKRTGFLNNLVQEFSRRVYPS
jgi:hypothetical protein